MGPNGSTRKLVLEKKKLDLEEKELDLELEEYDLKALGYTDYAAAFDSPDIANNSEQAASHTSNRGRQERLSNAEMALKSLNAQARAQPRTRCHSASQHPVQSHVHQAPLPAYHPMQPTQPAMYAGPLSNDSILAPCRGQQVLQMQQMQQQMQHQLSAMQRSLFANFPTQAVPTYRTQSQPPNPQQRALASASCYDPNPMAGVYARKQHQVPAAGNNQFRPFNDSLPAPYDPNRKDEGQYNPQSMRQYQQQAMSHAKSGMTGTAEFARKIYNIMARPNTLVAFSFVVASAPFWWIMVVSLF